MKKFYFYGQLVIDQYVEPIIQKEALSTKSTCHACQYYPSNPKSYRAKFFLGIFNYETYDNSN
ncbi:hypothetical protein LTZ17_07970 [Lacticaseibacillus casei]|nr:hypothetical protein [Lacticaseibacillus casei]